MTTIEESIIEAARSIPDNTTLREAAEKLVTELALRSDWEAWIHHHVVEYVHEKLRARLRSDRALEYVERGRRAFAEVCDDDDFAENLSAGVPILEWRLCVDDEDRWLQFGKCTRREIAFVRDDYSARAQPFVKRAAFYDCVARKTRGAKTVGDVFTEEALRLLWREVVGE